MDLGKCEPDWSFLNQTAIVCVDGSASFVYRSVNVLDVLYDGIGSDNGAAIIGSGNSEGRGSEQCEEDCLETHLCRAGLFDLIKPEGN